MRDILPRSINSNWKLIKKLEKKGSNNKQRLQYSRKYRIYLVVQGQLIKYRMEPLQLKIQTYDQDLFESHGQSYFNFKMMTRFCLEASASTYLWFDIDCRFNLHFVYILSMIGSLLIEEAELVNQSCSPPSE